MKFTLKIDEQDINNLQRAQYEYDTIFDLINRNNNQPSDFWLEKLVEANIRLNLYKNEITTKYIEPKVDKKDLEKTTWTANFRTEELEVVIDGK